MNKEYIYSEECVIVETDKGLEKREKTNNIIKILETENNIEELNNEKNLKTDYIQKEISDEILNKYTKKLMSFSVPISFVIGILLYILNVLSPLISLLGIPVIINLITTIIIEETTLNKSKKISNSIKKKQQDFLEKEIDNEKEKLKELNENQINDITYDIFKIGKIKKIERTKLIDDLKRKLELITDYQIIKDDIIKYSKDLFTSLKLRDIGYSEDDIKFLQMLMEQDIKLEKEKQKTLKLEKK